MSKMNILVLGAAYGLLPAVRVSLAGHAVTVMCRTEEQAAIASQGAKVSFLRRDGTVDKQVAVPGAPGMSAGEALGLAGPEVEPAAFDLILLAMSEPQVAVPEIAALLRRIGQAEVPVVSLMNALPPPFLARLGTIDVSRLKPAYTGWSAWAALDPERITAASPDAQAVRTDPARSNELSVTLGSNFKVAPFARAEDQELVEVLARDVGAYRLEDRPLPVRIMAHGSLHVPLAKWPMLMAGNCRCMLKDGSMIPIAEAVGADLDASRRIYEQTMAIVRATGAGESDLVPFAHYARAARSLVRPSSFARAIAAGAPAIERVDKIIQLTGDQLGLAAPGLVRTVEQVDRLMSRDAAA